MFTFRNRSGFQVRALLLSIAALPLLAAEAHGQVAPTLLPYTLSVIAGGSTATSSPAAGATCPVSGYKSTDAYGDGCLATEVVLAQPRFVTQDANGAVFFSDTGNGIIRRIDPQTGIISTVAGGAATAPTLGSVCGSGVSLDYIGNGCSATAVKLSKPMGLAFSSAGDLYFADNGNDDVRKIDHTTGIITNVAGNTSTGSFPVFGYATNNGSTTGPINAATQSYLNFPYGVAFDKAGNLYIADEGNQAVSVVNLGATPRVIQGFTVPAGSIQKIAGYGSLSAKTARSGECPNFTSTSSRGGCYFGTTNDGDPGNTSNLDNPYDVAVDAAGNAFIANYFNYNVLQLTPANIISNYAGTQGTSGSTAKRGTAGTFGIGNTFDVALDSSADLYISDGSNGIVWRVDAGTKAMYPVAGGATTVCATATDASGDGCPATQAILTKKSGSSATLVPGGAGGLFVSSYGDLYIADSAPVVAGAVSNVLRVASTGTWFGAIGANQPTQTVAVHFAAADGPAANPFSISSGASNFTLGAFNCAAANSDGTTDCFVAVTATPSALGSFSGTLTVKTAKGATANFALGGTFVSSPLTRTVLSYASGSSCTTTSVATTAPITLTASVFSTGSPTGTVTFFANGTQIGTPQNVSAGKATLTYTFSTPGSYSLTAKYSGDANFTTSTSSATSLSSSTPTFTVAANSTQQSTVTAGQTALYSFTVTPSVYTGTISFACSGLPAYATCVFSPTTISNNGCSTAQTVALSILTQGINYVNPAGFGGGPGGWQALGIVPGALLALLVGIRRKRSPLRYGRVYLALALLMTCAGFTACSSNRQITAATPSGTNTVTVTATGSTGTVTTTTVTLTVK